METLLREFMNKIDARFDDLESKMATKEDVADIPLIKQAVLETRETVANLDKSIDDLKNKNEEFARVQANHQKTLDLLSIKSVELEAKTRWV